MSNVIFMGEIVIGGILQPGSEEISKEKRSEGQCDRNHRKENRRT